MKKAALFIMLLAGTLSLKADGYAYLTFETADGKRVSVPLTSLTLNLSNSELTAGTQVFALSNLTKMYFSVSDETATGIASLPAEVAAESDESAQYYDLRGQRVSRDQMRSGIYIMKTKNKTAKIFVK
jgi:hypothetical protein